MEVLDATRLAERLRWEANEYWLHVEAESPFEKYPAKQHARRVQEKLGIEHGLIYLAGQELKNFEDSDMPSPFHQRRYFYYMSGCNEPDCHLAYNIQLDTLSLFIPRIEERHAVYYGPGMTLSEALMKFDVDEVYYADELQDFIAEWSHGSNPGKLYALHASQVPKFPQGFHNFCRKVDVASLQPAMNRARMIKDDHEIQLIRKANDISSRAHREVLANITKFKNEAQVEGLFRDICVAEQAKQQAYDPIAASGPNAGTLHYDANNEDFEDRQLMCLDAGCEYQLYASDITRTFPLSGAWPSKEAQSIYKLVERMQEACIKRIAPGVRYLDLHILAHQIAIDGLLDLGLLHNGTREEIYNAGTSKAFFLHGLGHHVGLEVHDVGQAELMSVRRGKPVLNQAPSLYPENFHLPVYEPKTCLAPADPLSSHLEEGMVVTVEPGIYFSVYALQKIFLPSPIHSKYINLEAVHRYMPVGGVRIEDDILVTSTGYENLTTAPKGDAMLQIIQSGMSTADRPWSSRHPRRQPSSEESPRFRAPGIISSNPTSILKPLSRAATMPTELRQRKSVDFEPFEGPSLFSHFKRSMTTDERVKHYQQSRRPSIEQQSPISPQRPKTMCGETGAHVRHIYMTVNLEKYSNVSFTDSERLMSLCPNCRMLYETLHRLRQHLNTSTKSEEFEEISKDEKAVEKRPQRTPEMTADHQTFRTGFNTRASPDSCRFDFTDALKTMESRNTHPRPKEAVKLLESPPRPRPIQQVSQLRQRHSIASFAPGNPFSNDIRRDLPHAADPKKDTTSDVRNPFDARRMSQNPPGNPFTIDGAARQSNPSHQSKDGVALRQSSSLVTSGQIRRQRLPSTHSKPAIRPIITANRSGIRPQPPSSNSRPARRTQLVEPQNKARQPSFRPGYDAVRMGQYNSPSNTTSQAQKPQSNMSRDPCFDINGYTDETVDDAFGKMRITSPVEQSLAEARNDIQEYWRAS